eukprot:TRINITY_DN81406_c0_g1_i1.p1 TRINITY_DN81406_c0_g1~~TRINITY_DN81406_c0_g1_i1.p1  ORF type:complete len:243 (+),score=61.59 TRINITY_DN81406_c0_g1_i1:62-790(+)
MSMEDMAEKLKAVFRKHDNDGSGNLKTASVVKVLLAINTTWTSDGLTSALGQMDLDKNGKISIDEFIDFVCQVKKPCQELAKVEAVKESQSLAPESQALAVVTGQEVATAGGGAVFAAAPPAAKSWTEEDEKRARHIFDICDKNSDEEITKIELIKACRASDEVAEFFDLSRTIRQEDGTRTRLEEVFQSIDGDDSRSISWHEFNEFCATKKMAKAPGEGMAELPAPAAAPAAIDDIQPDLV